MSVTFLYLLVEFTSVCYMIVVICKLELGIIEDSIKLILIIYKQLPSSIWRVIPGLIFTLYAPTYKAKPLLPSTLETLTDGLLHRWLRTYISTLPILEFSCARSWFRARFWTAERPKHCGSFTPFQEETDIGYDFCSGWCFTRYLDPSHHAKQPIFPGWVPQNDTIQCSLGHISSSDGLYPYASSISCFNIRPPYYKINTAILQGTVVFYAYSRVSNISGACPQIHISYLLRVMFLTIGYYYPFFFLQLDASKHGINETLTFYLVYTTLTFALLHRTYIHFI